MQEVTPFIRVSSHTLEEQLAFSYVQFHNKVHITGTNNQYFGLSETQALKDIRRISHELQEQLKAINKDIDERDRLGEPLAWDVLENPVASGIDWS